MMLSSPIEDRLADLLRKLSDEALSVAEWGELDATLAADDEAVARYVEYQIHEGLLHREFRDSDGSGIATAIAAADAIEPAEHGPSLARHAWHTLYDAARQPTWLSMLVSGLFLTTVLLSLALWTLPALQPPAAPPELDQRQFVAQLRYTQQARWTPESNIPGNQVADLYAGQQLELLSGLAEIRFDRGAVVLLEGPARFTVHSPQLATIEHGKLLARVPRQAIGFTIGTPTALVVDLGTEFGLEVSGEGAERRESIVVFEGEVVVTPREAGADRGAAIHLTAGKRLRIEGGRIEQSADVARPAAPTYQYLGPLLPNPQSDREDRACTKLTDGNPGIGRFTSGTWVGVQDNAPDTSSPQPSLLFDLSEAATIDQIVISYLVDHRGGVHAPDSATVAVSEDGRTFRQVHEFAAFDNRPNTNAIHQGDARVATIRLAPVRARFVRVDFFNDAEWTFLGEVTIRRPLDSLARGTGEGTP